MSRPLRSVLAAVAVLAALDSASASAQAPRTAARRCLTPAEVMTEQLVRHGVFLREAGNRCEDFTPGTLEMWLGFDRDFGPRMASQTDKRKRMFQRAFKDDWLKVMTYFDGRLVTYYRHFPLTPAYCANVTELLAEVRKRGWGGFTSQAKLLQNEVYQDYKVCR